MGIGVVAWPLSSVILCSVTTVNPEATLPIPRSSPTIKGCYYPCNLGSAEVGGPVLLGFATPLARSVELETTLGQIQHGFDLADISLAVNFQQSVQGSSNQAQSIVSILCSLFCNR